MARRLFLGNFDFEHRLAEPAHEPSAKLKRLNAELATAWLAIADDDDFLWTPEPIDPVFFQEISEVELARVIPIMSLDEVPKGTECVPWGWSHEVRRTASKFNWNVNAPSLDAVRFANSRATSNDLEQQWNVGIPGAGAVTSIGELNERIESNPFPDRRWVVKAEFGMSARERILGHGPLLPADENWVRRRLTLGNAVFFEPWVQRVEELGIQLDVPTAGEPCVVGIVPMLVDDRGQYAGSWFQFEDARFSDSIRFWPEATEIALRAARHLQSHGYFGPLGIDAMIYQDASGIRHLRPLQDINARWTMGRLSLGLRRFCRDATEGFWCHGKRLHPDTFESHRLVPTSPQRVGTEPCRHQSTAVFGRYATASP